MTAYAVLMQYVHGLSHASQGTIINFGSLYRRLSRLASTFRIINHWHVGEPYGVCWTLDVTTTAYLLKKKRKKTKE